MDPLSIITSTIAIIQAVSKTYDAIQHLSGLPTEFNEVSRTLPLAQNTLCLAQNQLQGYALDEPSKKALQPLLCGCEEKARMLQESFEEVGSDAENTKDGSVLNTYRGFLLRMGKAYRVEALMRGVLEDLDALATNQLFRAATQEQIALLEEAIKQLLNVDSSVPDSELEDHWRRSIRVRVISNEASYCSSQINTAYGDCAFLFPTTLRVDPPFLQEAQHRVQYPNENGGRYKASVMKRPI
jgi:hypothetical protein